MLVAMPRSDRRAELAKLGGPRNVATFAHAATTTKTLAMHCSSYDGRQRQVSTRGGKILRLKGNGRQRDENDRARSRSRSDQSTAGDVGRCEDADDTMMMMNDDDDDDDDWGRDAQLLARRRRRRC